MSRQKGVMAVALYRLEAKIISRAPKGKSARQVSVVAKAAYRSAQKLKDERQDKSYNYKARSQEVVYTGIVAPENAPDWLKHGGGREDERAARERLWNTVQGCEKRKDAQLAREFIIALPRELKQEQQIEAVRTWCGEELTARGMVADIAIHHSKDGNNPHAHILCTLRDVDGDGFGLKNREWNDKALMGQWRGSWETHCNVALERAGREERVDHRSLKDQGIDRAPEPKIGVTATAMQRKGVEKDPERVKLARWVKMENFLRPFSGSIREGGEVKQHGAGETWWERAQNTFDWTMEQARELLRDESSGGRQAQQRWQDYVTSRRIEKEPTREPEPDMGR